MSIPRATARLQLHRDFPFDAAVEIVPYLAKLGISHVYASPILAARPGSTHGYDTIDPTAINPELGGHAGLDRLSDALRRHEMGLIIDIVPNHMAAVAENPWWRDVLRSGRASRYAEHFDIEWDEPDPDLRGKVLLPCLGDTLAACLDRNEITVAEENGERVIRYFDQRFPLDPRSEGADIRSLLPRQNYLLAFWREAATRINWRRFFDINQLVALRIDRDAVFQDYHRLILDLRRRGIIDGVRVDHVDGLAEPIAYCRKLRDALDAMAPHSYLVIEKILHSGERLSADWSIHGTSGYDFMDEVSAVLHDPQGEEALTVLWQALSGDQRSFPAVAGDARREILGRLFPRQRDRLIAALRAMKLPAEDAVLRKALTELLACFRHYRLYGDESGFDEADTQELAFAVNAARPVLDAEASAALADICTVLPKAPVRPRFEQLSATLTAKAVEDTAFYRYSRLLSRNEVGSDPGEFALSPKRFHASAAGRRAAFPAAMLATATHDTKRGEDHRARLAVLSELAEEWRALAIRWSAQYPAPEPAIGLMIWQTIVGAWPPDFDAAAFHRRLEDWLVKALREAKQHTAWDNPNQRFECDGKGYLARLFDPDCGFLAQAESLVARIAPAGIRNSLAQTVLRLTTPGVPDLYQGAELWDFSLVDPDNRRPVDYGARKACVDEPADFPALLAEWRDGRIKQAVIARLLQFRREHPRLFAEGSYEPLVVTGAKAAHLIAFTRQVDNEALLVVVPRLTAGFSDATGAVWADTRIAWTPAPALDLFTGRTLSGDTSTDAAVLLDRLPFTTLHVKAGEQ
ncbi:malto-oligosyltrehalose synthase [Dongia sedimenti]|uniref:Malto-oligosyltrehalose synthase n=1 Tax=Dongia sedimenti TaxID=3064282 RepID=A0ABU0YUN6_9PROT|nr:malto-oligosyltrehalose synthase [Rhodospirillaceae bacterium R-7]